MPKIYKQNCKACGTFYKSSAKFACSVKCGAKIRKPKQPKFQVTSFNTKICIKCLEEQPIENFYRIKRRCLFAEMCKKCTAIRHKKYSEKVPKEVINKQKREYRAKNSEKVKDYLHNWYLKNKERRLLRTKERKKNDPEFRALLSAISANRRAREKGNGGSHTGKEWLDLVNYYGNKCLACGSKENITKDHIQPISKGGHNGITNLQPLCRSCNSKKGTRPWIFSALKHFHYFVKPWDELHREKT